MIGKESVTELRSMVVVGQEKHVVIEDDESMHYIASLLRNATLNGHTPERVGRTYIATLRLKNGQEFSIGLYIPSPLDGVIVSYPLNAAAEPLYYWLQFNEMIPRKLTSTFQGLQ